VLRIRREQMEALDQAAWRRFEQRAIQHLKETFPKHARFRGEEGLRNTVRSGLDRARQRGLTSERGLLLYLEQMMMLGSGFDTDPQLPWASFILSDQSIGDEAARVERLLERSREYFERVAGPRGEHIDRALQRVRQAPVEGFVASGGGDFDAYMRAKLNAIYPEKCADLGEEGLRALVRQGVEFARNHDLTTERGVVVSIVLMLFLGSGFAEDPQFPWAAQVLADPALKEPSARADRLYSAAKEYLERWLA